MSSESSGVNATSSSPMIRNTLLRAALPSPTPVIVTVPPYGPVDGENPVTDGAGGGAAGVPVSAFVPADPESTELDVAPAPAEPPVASEPPSGTVLAASESPEDVVLQLAAITTLISMPKDTAPRRSDPSIPF